MFCAVAPWHWTYGCTSFHLIKEAYFFGSNFEEWVYLDLISQISYDTSILWSKLWAMTYYFLWIWHSKHIHNFDFVMPFRSWCVILERYKDYNASALANPMNMVRTKHHIQVCWKSLPDGWVCLNTNGAVKDRDKKAGFGGLIRDVQGRWIVGFSKNLLTNLTFIAE